MRRLWVVIIVLSLNLGACRSWGKFWVTSILYPESPLLVTQNVAMAAAVPQVPGSPRSCSSTPALPAGLSLDQSTCAISGTPTRGTGRISYKISADLGSDTISGEIIIRVLYQPRFVYSGNTGSGNISRFVVQSDGSLSAATNYNSASGARFVLADYNARFLYVANRVAGSISIMTIATDGSLSHIAGSPVTTGANPYSLAFDAQGKFLYVGHESVAPNGVSAYAIDSTTGAITQISGSPFFVAGGATPAAVYADPSGTHLYVGSTQSTTNAHAFTINAATGALTQLAGSPYATINNAIAVYAHPSGQFVYYAQYSAPNGVVAFSRNATSGALALLSGSPFSAGFAPGFVTGDLQGRFVYVANSGDGVGNVSVSAYTVNATSGALSQITGSPFASGLNPIGFAVDDTGKYGYAANDQSGTVSAFSIDQTTGFLTPRGAAVAAGTNPLSVAVVGVNQ